MRVHTPTPIGQHKIVHVGALAIALIVLWVVAALVRPGLISHTAAAQSVNKMAFHQQQFDVLTLNVLLRPFLPEGQDRRAPLIAGQLKGYDVVLLQEAFSDYHRDIVLRGLRQEYPYQSNVLGRDSGLKQDGGVVVVSRWPIEAERQMLFGGLCRGKDCLADKGVLYTRINKSGSRIHLFATHLQSGTGRDVTREHQILRMRRWIDAMRLPLTEPVLIGGDLNVDLLADDETGAFTRMLEILKAAPPTMPADGQDRVTFDPVGNSLADGTRAKYLDYVLYSKAHLEPLDTFNKVRRIFADGEPLSDHYAVHGRFRYRYVVPPLGIADADP